MSEAAKCRFCNTPLITGDEAGGYCEVFCGHCGRAQQRARRGASYRVQPEQVRRNRAVIAQQEKDNARRARDRAQVERHVVDLLIDSVGKNHPVHKAAARILRYLRTTKKEWR